MQSVFAKMFNFVDIPSQSVLNVKDSISEFLNLPSSLSVPFDEDDRDDSVWFLDHDYLENMYGMFKKVNGE